ncbi:MAG: glycerol-3-phosphate dehydrogenase [Blastomonas sp.]
MVHDLLIIGGGINGAAIARDAAGNGLKVLLCEAGDLAGQTSSASSKLIHGGLRYLEHMEFRLVREALLEREVLLQSAPHIIWPLRIVLPHHKGLRPVWMLRLGLFLYDHLGARKRLPGTSRADLTRPPHAGILQPQYRKGFEFSDCWADDARLVVLCARDAADRGAEIRTQTRCTGLARSDDIWNVDLEHSGGVRETVAARAVVNAAGKHVDDVLEILYPDRDAQNLRLIKGSHIVLPRLYEGDHLYMFQNSDDRIVFAIPYEKDFTLIGTTDVPYDPADGPPKISDAEIDYLLAIANDYFARPVSRESITWTYSGVRPLFDDKSDNASTVTRDYVFDLDRGDDGEGAPLLSIFGGKITTCRKLAEHAMERLEAVLHFGSRPWTAGATLPGGDIEDGDFDRFLALAETRYPWLDAFVRQRLARRYGTRMALILEGIASMEGLGRDFGAGFYEAEAGYLIAQEWAVTAEDMLWRRTKRGLHMSEDEIAGVEAWVAGQG